jgi:hypothetical protein
MTQQQKGRNSGLFLAYLRASWASNGFPLKESCTV